MKPSLLLFTCSILLMILLDHHQAKSQRFEQPPHVVPIHYDLAILPILARNPRLCGHVYIDIEARILTNVVILNGRDLEILEVTFEPINSNNTELKGAEVRLSRIEEVCFDQLEAPTSTNLIKSDPSIRMIREDIDKEMWNFFLDKSMVPGEKYRMGLLYRGKVFERSEGFYRAKYTDPGSCCEKWVGATQMEGTHARRVLPCFDEPGFKPTFTVAVGHPNHMTALSNMPDRLTHPMFRTEGWFWTIYDRTPPMPSYLLAIVVTEYSFIEKDHLSAVGKKDGLPIPYKIRYWARKDQLPLLNRTIEITPLLLAELEKAVQQPYSLPKLDMFPYPGDLTFAAMENWGLILFDRNAILHDELRDSEQNAINDAGVIAHELAHQFFGNLLTSDWWNELWLNEGGSVLFESPVIIKVKPEWESRSKQGWFNGVQDIIRQEERAKKRYLSEPADTLEVMDTVGDGIVYQKGSAILRMVWRFLGNEIFGNGLINYYERYKFQSVNSDKLWAVLDEELHRSHDRRNGRQMSVHTIMNTWTRQGYFPIIRCEWVDPSNRRIRVSQRPYPAKEGNSSALWWVPIPLTDSSRADFSPSALISRLWLSPQRPSLEVLIPSPKTGTDLDNDLGWVILNGEMSGYYRVQYDDRNYRLLSRQLMQNYTVIPDITRSQLISDAFALAEAGLIDYEDGPLQLIRYLKTVKDEFVRSIVVHRLEKMKQLSASHSQINIYTEYLKQLTKSLPSSGEENYAREGASLYHPILSKTSCDGEDEICVDKARQLYRSMMTNTLNEDEKKAVAEEMEVVWCTAIRHGGESEWNYAWKKSLHPDWSLQKPRILSALSCSKDSRRLKRLLSRVFHHSIEQSAGETLTMLQGMTENPAGRSLALRFVTSNFKQLNELFGRSSDSIKLISAASIYAKTTEEYKEMSNFLARQKAVIPKTELNAILDNIRSNIRWVESRSEKVSSIVRKFISN